MKPETGKALIAALVPLLEGLGLFGSEPEVRAALDEAMYRVSEKSRLRLLHILGMTFSIVDDPLYRDFLQVNVLDGAVITKALKSNLNDYRGLEVLLSNKLSVVRRTIQAIEALDGHPPVHPPEQEAAKSSLGPTVREVVGYLMDACRRMEEAEAKKAKEERSRRSHYGCQRQE